MAASLPTMPQPTESGPDAARGLQPSSPSGPSGPRRPSALRRAWRMLWRVLAGLALLLLLSCGGLLLALRSPAVQDKLVEKLNAALDKPLPAAPENAPEAGASASAVQEGLRIRITHLSGPLPFGARLGLELSDGRGLWLRLPEIRFAWDWRALPGVLRIAELRVADAALLRLPQLPPGPPPEPAPPLTREGLRQLLEQTARTLTDLPGWLPEVRLEGVALENAQLPASLLGATAAPDAGSGKGAAPAPAAPAAAAPAPQAQGTPAPADGPVAAAPSVPAMLRADLHLEAAAQATGARLRSAARLAPASGPAFTAGGAACAAADVELTAALTPVRQDKNVTLTVKTDLTATLTPAAEEENAGAVGLLRAPLRLELRVQGPLDAPHMLLTLDGADVRPGGRSLTDAALRLEAAPLRWTALLTPAAEEAAPSVAASVALAPAATPAAPASDPPGSPERAPAVVDPAPEGPAAASAEASAAPVPADREDAAPELALSLDLGGALDAHPLQAHAVLFAARTQAGLRAGLRDFSAQAAGAAVTGALAAQLPEGSPQPLLDGGLAVRVADWQALAALLPGARLSGDVGLSLQLRSRAATTPAAAAHPTAEQAASGAGASVARPAAAAAPDAASATAAASAAPSLPAAAAQDATLTWSVPQLSYSAAGAAPLQVRGLTGAVRLTDLWGAGRTAAELDLAELRQAELRLGARLRATGSLRGPLHVDLQTTGTVAAHVAALWQPGSVAVERLEARLEKKNLGVAVGPGLRVRYGEAGFGLEGLDLRLSPSGRLRGRAAKDAAGIAAQLTLEDLDLRPWRSLAEGLPEGMVSARVDFRGKAADPGGDLRLEVRDLRLPNSPLKPLRLTLTGRIERAGGDALALKLLPDPETVRALGGSECRVEARLPLHFGPDGVPAPDMQGPLRGAVRWKGAVGPIWSLVPVADQRLGGQLDLHLDVGGSLAAPALKGYVRMDGGRYENVQLGAQLQDISLQADLEQQGVKPGKARLRLAAADGLGGTLRVAGQAGLDGAGLDIVTTLDRLRPLRRRDVRIDLSGRVAVTGTAAAPEVRGEVRVNQGEVWLNKLAVTGSVTTLPISAASAPVPASAAQAPAAAADGKAARAASGGAGLLDLRLVMPGRFSVEGYGLKSLWRADMHVGGTPAAPVMDGQVEAAKGSLDFMGKNFNLERGRVSFAGGSPGNPMLDLLLSNETPELTAYIALTGTVRKLQLALRSEPEVPRDEILAQILFGKSTSELGRLENLRLAAAVAQLAGFGGGGGGSLADFGRKTLGVDVLRLNTDSGSSSGASSENSEDMTAGASVEMGKYLTEELYVGVQQGMKEGSTAFIIQWELTSRANLELRTEQDGTWGGFRWKYNY